MRWVQNVRHLNLAILPRVKNSLLCLFQGNNNGHGGLLGKSFIFIKTSHLVHPSTPQNAVCLHDGHSQFFKDNFEIIRIE